jgi:hypothetical protein
MSVSSDAPSGPEPFQLELVGTLNHLAETIDEYFTLQEADLQESSRVPPGESSPDLRRRNT